MRELEPVRIPREVLEDLESVRRYTRAEVLDIPTIRHVAMERGKPALVVWIDEHEQQYGQGLLNGFQADDQAAVDGTTRPEERNQDTARDLSALVASSQPHAGYGRVSGERKAAVVQESVQKMNDKAWGMLKHMRRQILSPPTPYVVVRGAALSAGVNPGGSECDGLIDELVQAGYIQTYPNPSLTTHGLYRLTDRDIVATKETAAQEGQPYSSAKEAQTGVRRP